MSLVFRFRTLFCDNPKKTMLRKEMAMHISTLTIKWNLDLTKSLGTGLIRWLNRGRSLSFIYFTITGAKNTIRYIEVSLNRGSLNRGSTVPAIDDLT